MTQPDPQVVLQVLRGSPTSPTRTSLLTSFVCSCGVSAQHSHERMGPTNGGFARTASGEEALPWLAIFMAADAQLSFHVARANFVIRLGIDPTSDSPLFEPDRPAWRRPTYVPSSSSSRNTFERAACWRWWCRPRAWKKRPPLCALVGSHVRDHLPSAGLVARAPSCARRSVCRDVHRDSERGSASAGANFCAKCVTVSRKSVEIALLAAGATLVAWYIAVRP